MVLTLKLEYLVADSPRYHLLLLQTKNMQNLDGTLIIFQGFQDPSLSTRAVISLVSLYLGCILGCAFLLSAG